MKTTGTDSFNPITLLFALIFSIFIFTPFAAFPPVAAAAGSETGSSSGTGSGGYVPTVSVKTMKFKNNKYTIFKGVDKVGQNIGVLVGKNGIAILSLERMKSQVKAKGGYLNNSYKKPLYQVYFYPDAGTNTLAFRVLKNGSGLSYYDAEGKVIIYRFKDGSRMGGPLKNSRINALGASMDAFPQPSGGGVSKTAYVKLKGDRYIYSFESVDGLIYFVTNGKKSTKDAGTFLFGVLEKTGSKYKAVKIFKVSPLKNGNVVIGLFRHEGGNHELYFQFDNLRHRIEFGTIRPKKNIYYVPMP